MNQTASPRLLVRGDLDGFFGLAVDNLIQFLLIIELLTGLCGIDAGFVVGRILPGAAVSLILGNLFYGWQARRLMRATGRDDVTALPFGINTVSLFAFVLFVIQPTYQQYASTPGWTPERAATVAWQVGLVACLLSGVIETLGGLVAFRQSSASRGEDLEHAAARGPQRSARILQELPAAVQQVSRFLRESLTELLTFRPLVHASDTVHRGGMA